MKWKHFRLVSTFICATSVERGAMWTVNLHLWVMGVLINRRPIEQLKWEDSHFGAQSIVSHINWTLLVDRLPRERGKNLAFASGQESNWRRLLDHLVARRDSARLESALSSLSMFNLEELTRRFIFIKTVMGRCRIFNSLKRPRDLRRLVQKFSRFRNS